MNTPSSWLKGLSTTASLGALGVMAAGLLLAEVNLLSSRHYFRVDVSEGQSYTLSGPSRDILKGLRNEVEIVVLLSSSDAQFSEARQLLVSYQALSPLLTLRYIDPDRDTAEFLALGRKFDIGTEEGNSGGVVADASFLVTSGKKKWFIRRDRLSMTDEEGRSHSRIESQLTEAIARVQDSAETRVCFVSGHGERSLDDGSPEGLLELRHRLTRSNIAAVRVPLDVVEPLAALEGCATVAIVGPSRPWPKEHENALVDHWSRGNGLLLFLDPIIGDDGAIVSAGLDALSRASGTLTRPSFVLEKDSEKRLPTGLGEIFFASPKAHPITRGLSAESARVDARVLMVAASALERAPGSSSVALLETSHSAISLPRLAEMDSAKPSRAPSHALSLALAMKAPPLKGTKRGARAVTVGTSNLAWNRSFRDPALYGNRLFVENAFSWVIGRPALVSVPERPPMKAGLHLSEDSLSSLLRYVLFYMPLAAASAGAFFLFRRRRLEEESRALLETKK